jgi:hypothetical protein
VSGLDQINLDGDGDVGPRRRARASTEAGAPEERVEQISDRGESIEVGSVSPGPEPFVAVAVIGRTPLGVRQDLVSLGRLLELLLGVRVVRVDVGVKLAGQLTKGLLDLPLRGRARGVDVRLIGRVPRGARAWRDSAQLSE